MAELDRIERELREVLEGVTPGPWTLEIDREDYVVRINGEYAMCDTTYYPTALHLNDARYAVAVQPENIRLLLDALAQLRAERDEVRKALEDAQEALRVIATGSGYEWSETREQLHLIIDAAVECASNALRTREKGQGE